MFHYKIHVLQFLLTEGILDKPRPMFNVDETCFGKPEYKEKVFTEKVRKHSNMYTQCISITSHITANICVSVSGRVLPTFVIYENSFPCGIYRAGEVTE